MRIKPCRLCDKVSTCETPCAEKIDYDQWNECCDQSQKEWIEQKYGNEFNNIDVDELSEEDVFDLTYSNLFHAPLGRQEALVVTLFAAGKSRGEVRKLLKITSNNLRQIINRIKKKICDGVTFPY